MPLWLVVAVQDINLHRRVVTRLKHVSVCNLKLMTLPASKKILKTAALTTTFARDKQANNGIPNQFGKAAGSTPFHAHDSAYLTYCSLPLISLLNACGAY